MLVVLVGLLSLIEHLLLRPAIIGLKSGIANHASILGHVQYASCGDQYQYHEVRSQMSFETNFPVKQSVSEIEN